MAVKLFISHAHEDKDAVARPLAEALLRQGLNVWYDEFSLSLGDKLRQSIEAGISKCDFGIVVLSPAFFKKDWPKAELDGLFTKEIDNHKVILPVWHHISRDEVLKHSVILADRIAASTSDGLESITKRILAAVRVRAEIGTTPATPLLREDADVIFSRLDGRKVKAAVIDTVLQALDLAPDSVEEAKLMIMPDLTGIDDYESGILLKDGSEVPIYDDKLIFNAAVKLTPLISSRFHLVAWCVEGASGGNESDPIEDRKICLMHLREPHLESDNLEASVRKLRAMAMAVSEKDDTLFERDTYRLSDGLFHEANNQPTMIVRSIVNKGGFRDIESLVFNQLSTRSRWAFLIASSAVEYLSELGPAFMAGAEKNALIQRLIDEPEPLNSYWTESLKKYID
jgi:hypothetical protein